MIIRPFPVSTIGSDTLKHQQMIWPNNRKNNQIYRSYKLTIETKLFICWRHQRIVCERPETAVILTEFRMQSKIISIIFVNFVNLVAISNSACAKKNKINKGLTKISLPFSLSLEALEWHNRSSEQSFGQKLKKNIKWHMRVKEANVGRRERCACA